MSAGVDGAKQRRMKKFRGGEEKVDVSVVQLAENGKKVKEEIDEGIFVVLVC